ncbi:hypothetical protein [Methanosarcina siciliae]|uniref:hypothetical protein n=1 Tax=Methanosarcina siciliae TaxID=38027 RepID=UPI0012E0558A|nr:hypothetical protein [Methanosarcina siciliae]
MVCLQEVVRLADETIEKLVYDLEAKVDKAIAGFDKVEKSINNVDKKMDKSSKAMEKGAALVARAWQMVAVAITAAIALMARATVKSSADMESYMIVLENLYGDLETAGDKMEWLLDFAQRTPFELPGLVDAMTKLKAYGIEFETVIGTLGDTASAMSKPLDMAVEALADAQTGEFERLKEFGIKAVEITKSNYEALGATQEQVGLTALTYTDSQMQQAIKVIDRNNREAITTAVTGIWDEKYKGGMEALASSAKGIWSNIGDSLYKGQLAFMGFDEATKAFREGSLFDRMKTSLEGLLDVVQNVDFEGAGKGIEKFLGWMDKGKEIVQPFAENATRQAKAFAGMAKDMGRALGTEIHTDLSGLKLLLRDVYVAFLLLQEGATRVYEYIDSHNFAERLMYALRLTAEAASLTYITIRNKLVSALDIIIEKYNSIVPILQKAGFDAEVISTDMFNPLKTSAKDAHETVKSETEQMVSEYQAAIDEMQNTASGADIVPGKRASYAQIMGVDDAKALRKEAEARGEDTSFLSQAYNPEIAARYSFRNIPAADIPKGGSIPAAAGLPAVATGQTQTAQQVQTSKYTEILKQMIESTSEIIKTLKEEPRKADISIDMDITTNQDVKQFEKTTLQAVSDGVRGKAQVV